MSTFITYTKAPKDKKYRPAIWIDDYFGHHRYGVRFEKETETLLADAYKFKIRPPRNVTEKARIDDLFAQMCKHGLGNWEKF